MDTQKAKSRKTKKLAKQSRLQKILTLIFRGIEIIVVLVTIAKLWYEVVITFEDSGVAAVILANRSLAFVIANAIVIALIANSGFLLNQELDPKCKSNDLYQEFVMESSRGDGGAHTRSREKQNEEEETENSHEAKQIIVAEKKTKLTISEKRVKQSTPEKKTVGDLKMEKHNKRQSGSYQRSQSESIKGLEKSACGRLRRSGTDAYPQRFDSDDELRYKIESFIARQRRNQNDE